MKDEQKLKGMDPFVMFERVWRGRRMLLLFVCVGVLFGFVISWSTPNAYQTVVKIVPDKSTGENGNFISDVILSKPFLLNFWDIQVNKLNETEKVFFRDYILKEQKYPWWKQLMDLPSTIQSWRYGKQPIVIDTVNLFRPTPEQMKFVGLLRNKIKLQVDKRSGIMNLIIVMQDPMISALVANEVFKNMEKSVKYQKTNKASVDLQFYEKLRDDASTNYREKQDNLNEYVVKHNRDNSDVSLVEQERLKQEIEMAYKSYISLTEELNKAKMKVQEETPVFAILEPATVPAYASVPQTLFIVFGCIFLFGFCGVIWLLVKGIFK